MGLSGKYTKGIEIEIGGNATKLKNALDESNRSIKTTQTELDTLKNSLKLEWDSSQFQRAQELAQRVLAQTEEKADSLRKALAAMGDSEFFTPGESEQYEAIRRELSYVEVAAQKAKSELTEISRLQFSELGKSTRDLDGEIENIGASLETTNAKLSRVRENLEKRWSAETFEQAQRLAQDAITQTGEKADLLREKLQSMEDAGTQKTSAEYQRLERELEQTENAAAKAHEQLQSINQVRLDQINKGLRSASEALSGAGNMLTMGLTVPLVAAGTASVKYASDTAEAMNKVEVAFGYAAEGVKKWSDTTLTSYGLAKGTALDMAALFGDMATSMGYSQAEAANMSKTLVGLAADMASFKNISIDQASTALKSVFTGETESLKNLGIVMTEVNLKEYALAQGIKTSYTEMGQAEKVALRYQYVLDKTKNAQGDFARTSDGTANQLRIFQESLKEAASVAGDELLPVITPIIAQLSSLIQTFGDLDEGTRKAVVQAGLFLAMLGPMLKLTGGVTQAVSAGVSVYNALKVSLTTAAAAQTGLNVAMSATPVGAVITAVGALVAVLGSLAAVSALTAEKTDGLNQKIRESREAYADATTDIRTHQADTLSMAATLKSLTEAEEKTAAQKGAILNLVDKLNAAVPELSLAYDAETDSLNMTAEAIRRTVIAEAARQEQEAGASRLADAYQEEIEIAEKLKAAKDDLLKAEANYAEYDGVEAHSRNEQKAIDDARGAVVIARAEVERLTASQADNGAEVERLKADYDGLTNGLNGAATATGEASAVLLDLKTSLEKVQGSYEILAKAQKEQADGGSLSIDTVTMLLDKYPELASYLVATANGYILTDGALQDYIASQRAEYDIACNNASSAAQAIVDAEVKKRGAILDTTASVKEQIQALIGFYGAEIDAMQGSASEAAIQRAEQVAQRKISGLQDLLNKMETNEANRGTLDRTFSMLGRDTASKSGGGSSKKGKTEAEKDLEAYREAVKQLDHERAMDRVSEEDYYKRKAALGALYLKAGQDERRKLDEELYEYQKGAYERDLAELDKALENEEITRQEHQEGLKALQAKHLTEGSEEWKKNDAMQAADRKAAYDDKLDDLKYFRDVEIVSESDYYLQLYQLQQEFLEEGSDEWRRVNKELHDYTKRLQKETLDELKRNLDEQLSAAKESYNARVQALKDSLSAEKDALKEQYSAEKDAAKAAYEAKKNAIKAELDLEKKRLNDIIAGIDAEIQARRELREDEDQDSAIAAAQKRLDAAKAQLEFARSDEDKKQWADEVLRMEAALKEAVQKKEDTEFYREKEEEKDAVKDQIQAAQDEANAKLDAAEKSYDSIVSKLEAQYNANLKKLEADYNARIAAAEAEYQAMVERLNQKYEERSWDVKNGTTVVSGGGQASSGNMGHVADALAGALGAVAGKVAQVVNTVQHVTNTKSANVNINNAPNLTSGQIAAAVNRALEALDR